MTVPKVASKPPKSSLARRKVEGWSARTERRSLVSLAEWQMLLILAADTEAVEDDKAVPALSVARIKSFYDGTLFYKLAKQRAWRPREKSAAPGHL